MKRRIALITTAFVMLIGLLSFLPLKAYAATAPTKLWVESTEANGLPAQIDVFKKNIGSSRRPNYVYRLYLPGNVSTENCFLSWDGDMQATVNGRTYASGSCPIPASLETQVAYTFRNNNQTLATFNVTAYKGSPGVTPVFIQIDETLGTIEAMKSSKDNSCSGVIYIDGQEYELTKMKGRGNATWTSTKDKKPYNLTLGNKINFPGVDSEKTKKWSLLAEALDHSLLCNRSGFLLAHEIGIGQDTASADVWMNGEYQGCYTITPKTDSFITKDGFLIEQDNYLEPAVEDGGDPQFKLNNMVESSGWTSCYNRITFKKIGDNLLGLNGQGEVDESPANMVATAEGIMVWLQDAWDAIRSDTGYNEKGKYYTDYIDIESFAKMYLMHEYVKSFDVCAGSILFHRDGSGEADKLIAGPIWDLDNALGSTCSNRDLGAVSDRRSAQGVFIQNISEPIYKTSIYKTIYKHQDFKDAVRFQYNKHKAAFDSLKDDAAQMVSEIEASANMNDAKVEDLGTGQYDNLHYYRSSYSTGSGQYAQTYVATTTWANYAANLLTYIRVRSLWFASATDGFYDPDFVDPATCEHQYVDDVTLEATCTSEGSVTHACPICKDSYTEIIPMTDHDYQDGVCTVCGQVLRTATIACDSGASVTVYATSSFDTVVQEKATSANPRDSSTGRIDCGGDGQINLVVNVKPGYELVDVAAGPKASYKNLKLPSDTGVENGYKLTKVTGDLTITVQTIQTGPTIARRKLLLSSEIGVQFEVVLPEGFDAADSYMSFAVSDGRTSTEQFADARPVDGNENARWFTCYVNALELADTVEATYHYGDGEAVSDDYSAVRYIAAAKQQYPGKQKLCALVDALQNYGHYLQESGWTDGGEHVAISAVSELDQGSIASAREGVSSMAVIKEVGTSGLDVMFTLTLNSATVINIFVAPGDDVTAVTGATAHGTRQIDGKTYWQYDTNAIGAGNLGKTYEVSLSTSSGTATVKASAMSYVDSVLNGTSFSNEQKLAMAAYYNYFAAATDYKN